MLKKYLRLLRVEQWYKNFIVFIALFFTLKFFELNPLLISIAGFFAFSFISSASYILNDLHDIEYDKKHKEKKKRPLASGEISKKIAVIIYFILIFLSLLISVLINPKFIIFPALFFLNTTLYTFYFNKIAILDLESIAVNYILRAVGGAVLINSGISPWLLIFVFVLSLFLVASKRKSDLNVLKGGKKKVFETYNEKFLNYLITTLIGSMIVFYVLYAFMAYETLYMLFTIPIAIFLAFRFLYFVSINDIKSRKVELLFKDKQFLMGLILLFLIILVIFYLSK